MPRKTFGVQRKWKKVPLKCKRVRKHKSTSFRKLPFAELLLYNQIYMYTICKHDSVVL